MCSVNGLHGGFTVSLRLFRSFAIEVGHRATSVEDLLKVKIFVMLIFRTHQSSNQDLLCLGNMKSARVVDTMLLPQFGRSGIVIVSAR